ncbi:MAG: hypothetical protein GXP32_05985 [Kiritimatiellaeota bacterium]|nr:hypothetical protein [Kiritimatiellota bacterium]
MRIAELFFMDPGRTGRLTVFMICTLFSPFSRAAEKIKNIVDAPQLEVTSEHQQKAIADLVSALKEVRKVVLEMDDANAAEMMKNKKREKDPFSDKQKYKAPRMPPKDNPEVKLGELQEKQEDVLKEMEKKREKRREKPGAQGKGSGESGTPDKKRKENVKTRKKNRESAKVARKNKTLRKQNKGDNEKTRKVDSDKSMLERQKEITEKLARLAKDEKLTEQLKRSLERAEKSSRKAQQAMSSHAEKIAETEAEKTNAAIKDSLSTIKKQSGVNTQNALKKVAEKTNTAMKKVKNSPPGRAKKEIDEKLSESIKELDRQARQEHKSGSQKNAEKLAELAERISEAKNKIRSDDAKAKKLVKLMKIKKKIDEMRAASQKSIEQFRKNVDNLGKLKKELNFAVKKNASVSPRDKEKLLNDIELAMQDTLAQMNNFKPGYQLEKETSKVEKNDETVPNGRNRKSDEATGSEQTRSSDSFNQAPYLIRRLKRTPDFKNTAQCVIKDMTRLIYDARELLKSVKDTELVTHFNIDEVPEEYKDDVSEYFRSLSEKATDRK